MPRDRFLITKRDGHKRNPLKKLAPCSLEGVSLLLE
jgi:hypothetical protein